MLSSTFHDEKLISVAVTDEALILEVSLKGKVLKITVSGLERLRVTDFKEGNIINSLQVICHDPRSASNHSVRSLLMYVYDLDDASLERNSRLTSFINEKLKAYEQGAIHVLELDPSYGAYLVAVGSEILEEEKQI